MRQLPGDGFHDLVSAIGFLQYRDPLETKQRVARISRRENYFEVRAQAPGLGRHGNTVQTPRHPYVGEDKVNLWVEGQSGEGLVARRAFNH